MRLERLVNVTLWLKMALSKKYLEMAINACVEKLADSDPQVRAKAAKSLGELGSEEAIPFLCQ
jgi:HEAT repeat protein